MKKVFGMFLMMMLMAAVFSYERAGNKVVSAYGATIEFNLGIDNAGELYEQELRQDYEKWTNQFTFEEFADLRILLDFNTILNRVVNTAVSYGSVIEDVNGNTVDLVNRVAVAQEF